MAAAASTFTATDGDAYERQMGRWSRRLAEAFLDFAGPVAAEERVLDLGCGTGSLSLALARRSADARICGLDFSPAYVDYAQRRAGGGDPRLEFRVGDACAIPFPEASFDRVLSLLMLHFVPRAPAAVAEMRRVARPGAVAAAIRPVTLAAAVRSRARQPVATISPSRSPMPRPSFARSRA